MAAYQQISSGSGYRVKFRRSEFLELVRIAQPKIIYCIKKMYFFPFDSFVIYTYECAVTDFSGLKIMEAVEFSNEPWRKF